MADARVDVHVAHASDARWSCPECGTALPCHERGEERVWRHLDMCGFQAFVHAHVPRVACPRHAVHDVPLPWARAGSRYTVGMEKYIADFSDSGGTDAASSVLGISWVDAWSVMMSRRVGV
jgi:transposase